MADNETQVIYRAIADFAAITRAARRARRELRELREEEARLNAQSAAGSAAASRATRQTASDSNAASRATTQHNSAIQQGTRSILAQAAANRQNTAGHRASAAAANQARGATQSLGSAYHQAAQGASRLSNSAQGAARSLAQKNQQGNALTKTFRRLVPYVEKVNNGFDRLGKWRPSLVPPFIALIPAIAGVLALLNPLVAGLGAVGGAAIGFASSIGRVAGAALGAVPALFTLISTVAALKVAFGGFGGAISAFKAAKNAKTTAGGGGGGGTSPNLGVKLAELTLQEKLARAQESYRRSIEDVRFAQEDLTEAKKDYIRRLADLKRAVDNAGLSEARAAANVQLAYEEYKRTLADPNASQGDRMAAEVAYKEALEEQGQVQEENKKNAADLAEMKKKGMKGDRQVIMAQRGVTDAVNRQRDAQLELINVRRRDAMEAQQAANAAATSPAAKAWDAYQEALSKLSPSARSVVEQLVAMDGAWQDVKRTVQEAFFSKIVDDVGRLRDLLPAVESLLSDTAGALGDVVEKFLILVTSDAWKSDLVLLGEGNVPIIKNIGDGLLALMDVFRNLTVIAQPFLEALSEGFKNGAENLKLITDEARKSGSLGKWLMGDGESRGVLDTLSQWWRIIKNIGKTIFNYSSAAREFSEWLVDGFERATEGWLASSEEATREDSPFKKWLENIKPLLEELSNLFGTFFSWFAEESGKTTNIEQMTGILRTITNELGPALATLLDNLSEAEIGQGFVDALVKIVEIISTLVDSGAVGTFFDVLNQLLDIIQQLLKIPGVDKLLGLILSTFGAIAAMSFVAKFSGLENFIGWLLKLSKGGGGLPTLVGKIADSFKKFPTAPGGGVLGGGGGILGGGKGALQSYGKHGAITPGQATYAPTMGPAKAPRHAKPSFWGRLFGAGGSGAAAGTATKATGVLGKATSLVGKAGSFLAKGAKLATGPVGAIASIVGSLAGDAIANGAEAGKAGSTQRVTGNVVSGASNGAGIGGAIGGMVGALAGGVGAVPGAAIGAGIGGAVGGAVGFFGSAAEDRETFLAETGAAISTFFTETIPGLVSSAGEGMWNGLKGFGAWLDEQWVATQEWWTNLPYNIGRQAGELWRQFTDFGTWCEQQWASVEEWWANLPAVAARQAGELWGQFKGFKTWLDEQWVKVQAWWTNLPAVAARQAGELWGQFKDFGVWCEEQFQAGRSWLTGLPDRVGKAAGDVWSGIKGIDAWLRKQRETFTTWVSGLGTSVANAASAAWESVKKGFTAGYGSPQKRHNGGVIHRAGGGTVPGSGNSDTVDAKLTPGEFVLRKAVVGRVGVDNLIKLNSGIMSYAQLLQAAQKNRKDDSRPGGTGSGVSYFSAGGLVPSWSATPPPAPLGSGSSPMIAASASSGHGDRNGTFVNIEEYTVINPRGETSEESLHSTVRKLDFQYGNR